MSDVSQMRAFRLAYDGTGYYGFQRQPDVPTIEGELFAALERLGVFSGTKPDGYAAAGRTDRGVSAVAQTIALQAPDWLQPRALNSELPPGIRSWAVAAAPHGFHATHDASQREYTYHLHAPQTQDAARARTVLDRLSGTHDFHNLTLDEENTKRTLETELSVDDPFLSLVFRAGGFSRQLVRRCVGLVDSVVREERALTEVERVLSSEVLSGPEGVPVAPSEPLVLTGVQYPELQFAADPDARASARTVFEEKRITRETSARVAETICDRMT